MDDIGSLRRSSKLPLGIYLAWKLCKKDFGLHECRILVLLLTFIAYACFHASRKPLSIVKSVLHPENSQTGTTLTEPLGVSLAPTPASSPPIGWAPFNGNLGEGRLGEIDVAFLASYAVGMYYAGRLGDRLDLRKFLTFGMVGSGACVCLFGMGYWWNIHSFSYYFVVQVITGLLSATGWPAVVAVVANWFGKTKRGLIMGIWNAHSSVGNIAGSIVAAAALQYGWGWSFVFPALAIMICGLLVFLFLVVEPACLGLPSPHEVDEQMTSLGADERKLLLADSQIEIGSSVTANGEDSSHHGNLEMPVSFGVDWEMIRPLEEKFEEFKIMEGHSELPYPDGDENAAIGFYEAWHIPGVALYAFCLFFVKLVAYTFLYWLPFYIRHTGIAGVYLTDKMSGYLSTIFDIGGVIGGIIAGHLSDKYNVKAIIAVIFVGCAIPSLYLFRIYGSTSLVHAVGLMIVSGIFVNGPYALITTAVSADLGTHGSLKGNGRALATVTAIIDGTGSVGAAIGPFLTGYISIRSWTAVFMMLAISSFVAGLFLTTLVVAEIMEKVHLYRGISMTEVRQEELREIES